jgi:hypothetical protein
LSSTQVLTRAIDSYTNQNRPKDNNGDDKRIRIRGDAGNAKRGYIYFALPNPEGSNVADATLSLFVKTAWSGSRTITVKRLPYSWKEKRITWENYSATSPGISTNATSVSVGSPTVGQLVTINVAAILQDAMSASEWYGFEITTTASNDTDFYSTETHLEEYRPELSVTWTTNPSPPRNLKPSGGNYVSLNKPVFTWEFVDLLGSTSQARHRIQIHTSTSLFTSTDSTLANPGVEFDSGWVSNTQTQQDMAATAWAGIADGATRYWRVAVEDGDGNKSNFSDPVSFTRAVKGILTITNPPGTSGDEGTCFVEETTPPIVHTYSGTQESVRYILEMYDRTDDSDEDTAQWTVIHKTGWKKQDAGISYTIPKKNIRREKWGDGTYVKYRITVRVLDDKDRQSTPGDPNYIEASKEFVFKRSSTPAPVDTINAETDKGGVTITWTRSATPDFFCLRVDDQVIDDRIEPDDVLINSGTYSIRHWGASPRHDHVYEIEPVVTIDGKLKHRKDNPTVTFRHEPMGVWLVDVTTDKEVFLFGQGAVQGAEIGERGETYFPVGRREPVRITDAVRGYEGTIQGIIAGYDDVSARAYRDRLERMKANENEVRLVFGDVSIPVVLGKVSILPFPMGDMFQVTAEYWQKGDFTFKWRQRK